MNFLMSSRGVFGLDSGVFETDEVDIGNLKTKKRTLRITLFVAGFGDDNAGIEATLDGFK